MIRDAIHDAQRSFPSHKFLRDDVLHAIDALNSRTNAQNSMKRYNDFSSPPYWYICRTLVTSARGADSPADAELHALSTRRTRLRNERSNFRICDDAFPATIKQDITHFTTTRRRTTRSPARRRCTPFSWIDALIGLIRRHRVSFSSNCSAPWRN